MKKAFIGIFLLSNFNTFITAQLWNKGALKQSDWNLSLKNIKVFIIQGEVIGQNVKIPSYLKYQINSKFTKTSE